MTNFAANQVFFPDFSMREKKGMYIKMEFLLPGDIVKIVGKWWIWSNNGSQGRESSIEYSAEM